MKTQFPESLQQYLSGKTLHGCTADEIAELESKWGVQLPLDYREFLLRAGRGAKGLWDDIDYTLDELPENQDAAVELLAAVGLELPDGAFVFSMYQGYQFFYLTADGVYYYHEGHEAPVKEHNSFAEFFEVAKNGW